MKFELLDLYTGSFSYLCLVDLLVGFSVILLATLPGGCAPDSGPRASEPASDAPKSASRTYVETFDDGPGGWYGGRKFALPMWDGVAYCYSPWWTDANHAPPGLGYLHMVMWAYTDKAHYQVDDDYTRTLPYRYSRFAEEGYSRNLTDAKLTVRLRGGGDFKGAAGETTTACSWDMLLIRLTSANAVAREFTPPLRPGGRPKGLSHASQFSKHEQNAKNRHALDTGRGADVTMGSSSSLERLQADPYGKYRINVESSFG